MEENSTSLADSRTVVLENDTYSGRFAYGSAGTALLIHALHQVLGPFAILLMRPIVGKQLLYNMRLGQGRVYLMELLFWLYTIGIIPFLYFKGERAVVFSIEIVYGLAVIMLRLLVVTVKYGTFTQKQWDQMLSVAITVQDYKQFQINHWEFLTSDTAYEEIHYAFTRLPVEVKSLQLVFRSEIPELLKLERAVSFVEETAEMLPGAIKVKIPALAAGEYLVERLCRPETRIWAYLARFAGYLYSILPFLVRLQVFGVASVTYFPDEILVSLITIYIGAIIVSNFYRFLSIGIADMCRKLVLVQECLIMSSFCNRQASLPKLDFSFAETAVGIYYLRRSFFDFGRRYMQRVHLYGALMLPVSVMVVLYVVLQALKLLSTGYNVLLIPCFYVAICSDVFLSGMILKAVKINKTFLIQRDLVLEATSRLSQSASSEMAAKRLAWAERKLAQDCSLRPLTILGVAISQSFVNQLAALLVSGVFAMIQLNS